MFWFHRRKSERQLLHEILCRIEQIERRLEVRVTLKIWQVESDQSWSINNEGDPMASIQAGNSGTFVVSGTASDNSDVTLSSITLTADDAAVTIAPDTTDASGATFTVSVPASDTGTVVNLTANASAVTSTSTSPTVTPATLSVTIQPGQAAVTVTLAINQK